jgi:hypothetical protein
LRLKMLLVVGVMLLLLSGVAQAQEVNGNYQPMDPSRLPQVPGCTWFPNADHPGLYDQWCGPDSDGNWYTPYNWYLLTGIYPPDYGEGGG